MLRSQFDFPEWITKYPMDNASFSTAALSRLDPNDANFAVDAIELILPMAITRGASDVHLQPRENGWEVLFRIDGVLSVVETLPGGGASDPVTRLMVLSGLPTYRSGQPMEGRLSWSKEESPGSKGLDAIGNLSHGPRASSSRSTASQG